MRLSFVKVGRSTMLNVFEIVGNTEADRLGANVRPGRIDHIGLEAASLAAFDAIRARLLERGHRRIRDRLRCRSPPASRSRRPRGELCLHNPAATPVDLAPRHPGDRLCPGTLRHVSGEREISGGYAATAYVALPSPICAVCPDRAAPRSAWLRAAPAGCRGALGRRHRRRQGMAAVGTLAARTCRLYFLSTN